MNVAASVRFEASEFGPRITQLRCEPPLVLCETSAGLMMLGAAAGPLGGDHWALSAHVGAGCDARIGSVAATVAQPGRECAESSFDITADVDELASLHWSPEPLVVAEKAMHRSRIDVTLATTSRLYWRDVVVLGRHGQRPGRAITRWRVSRAGQPLLAHDLDIGAGAPTGWDGPAVLGGSRVVGSLLIVDPALASAPTLADPPAPPAFAGLGVFTLAGPAILFVARGQTTVEVFAALENAAATQLAAVEA